MISSALAQSVPGPSEVTPLSTTQASSSLDAPAATSHTKGFDWMGILPMVLIFAVFYFFMIRPQQKKMKQQRELLAQLKVGDHVVTTAGILGVIHRIENEQHLMLEVEDGVRLRILRSSVSEVTPRASSSSSSGTAPTPKKETTAKSPKAKGASSKKNA